MIASMDRDQYLASYRRDSRALLDAITAAGPDAVVPDCPGWTAADLAWHMVDVWEWWGLIVRDRVTDPGAVVQSTRPDTFDEVLAAAEHWAGELDRILTATDPATPHWTWTDDKTTGFVVRRMAQETAVHRVDVESAFDAVTAVEHDLAVDGIDEVLDLFLVYQAEDVGPDGPGRGTVAVRTGQHIWRLTLSADDVALSREPGPADAVVSGEPSELLLWLWGRRPDSAVQLEGDTELLAGFRARLRVVTQ